MNDFFRLSPFFCLNDLPEYQYAQMRRLIRSLDLRICPNTNFRVSHHKCFHMIFFFSTSVVNHLLEQNVDVTIDKKERWRETKVKTALSLSHVDVSESD